MRERRGRKKRKKKKKLSLRSYSVSNYFIYHILLGGMERRERGKKILATIPR